MENLIHLLDLLLLVCVTGALIWVSINFVRVSRDNKKLTLDLEDAKIEKKVNSLGLADLVKLNNESEPEPPDDKPA